MSALATRLSALRAQAGVVEVARQASSPPPAIEAEASPIPEQLRRLLGIRVRSQAKFLALDRQLPGIEIADGLRLIERLYPWPDIPSEVNAQFAGFGRIDRDQLMYFDTETTGLSGGTGTRAFMIGAADCSEGGLRIRQLLITTMAGELAMLQEFARWLDPGMTLVSYNGKSYDAPLLATRFRLNRLPNPLSGLRHLDLLYPVRRRFRGVWENCRLCTVEREWLGVVRDDDLPGSEAPRAWRDYLRGLSATRICAAWRHCWRASPKPVHSSLKARPTDAAWPARHVGAAPGGLPGAAFVRNQITSRLTGARPIGRAGT